MQHALETPEEDHRRRPRSPFSPLELESSEISEHHESIRPIQLQQLRPSPNLLSPLVCLNAFAIVIIT